MTNNKGLYLHIPYCPKKCGYCDFLSFSSSEGIGEYFKALLKEIRLFGEFQHGVDSVFIGGGTPSLVSPTLIEEIIGVLKENFKIREGAEITIEMNPESVTEDKLSSYLRSGINRFSLGVQSFNDESLKVIGRIHNSSRAEEVIKHIQTLGIKNFNIDMMMALPYQTLDALKGDVERLLLMNPSHISYYSLIVEEGTPLFDLYDEKSEVFPSEDLDREMYHYILKELEGEGYIQYEISNFAKEGFESRHNLKYWSLEEYIGMGLGASSFINGKRTKNMSDQSQYIELIELGQIPLESSETVTKQAMIEDFMIFGIRKTEGLSRSDFKERFGLDMESIYGEEIRELLGDGLLEWSGDFIRLTKKGMDLSNICELKFLR